MAVKGRRKATEGPSRRHSSPGAITAPAATWARGPRRRPGKLGEACAHRERRAKLGDQAARRPAPARGPGQAGDPAPPGGAVGRLLARPADKVAFLLRSVSSHQPIFIHPER